MKSGYALNFVVFNVETILRGQREMSFEREGNDIHLGTYVKNVTNETQKINTRVRTWTAA